MPVIGWEESYSVNINSLDKQHRVLFSIYNDLYDTMERGKADSDIFIKEIIYRLSNYALVNFSSEEQLMKKFNYRGYLKHKKEHDLFREKLKDLKRNYQVRNILFPFDILWFLADFIIDHNLVTDKEYSDLFIEHGVT